MSPRVQRLDLGVVCHLVADHLRTDGEDASAHGREIRVEPGLKLKLVPEPDQLDDQLASMFWIEVEGLNLEPQMRLDVSGWGTTLEDQAIDAAHGVLEAILPPVRWLAAEPWETPNASAGRNLTNDDAGRRGWSIVAGDPWVIVALGGDTDEPDEAASALRTDLATFGLVRLDPLPEILDRLEEVRTGHWIKIFAGRYGDEHQGRIDIDNEVSIDGASLAAALPWRDVDGIQMVRQLMVLRPDGEASRLAKRRSRLPFWR